MIILVFVSRKSIHFWQRYARKTSFYIFFLSYLDLGLWVPKLAPLVTLLQRYVYAKVEFLRISYFEKIGDTGRTDRRTVGRRATLNVAL